MTRWDEARNELRERPRRWLVTGAAGFIGSSLVEELLRIDQEVVGLDDFSTGHRANLSDIERRVGAERFSRFRFIEGDIRETGACREACADGPLVLHQAALGSVPRSIEDPELSFSVNVGGFVNMLEAARSADCPRFVYASSSSVYGDHPQLPKVESELGALLSPYAATKRINEVWANTYHCAYGMPVVGLRYFNVFGPRQDPHGPYAAVIPRWIEELKLGQAPRIFGDGETSRDFCPVANAVQANVLAALAPPDALGRAFNVALAGRTTLNELVAQLRDGLAALGVDCADIEPIRSDFRPGDVRHSLADISQAHAVLGYEPEADFAKGVRQTLEWYTGRARPGRS